MKQELNCYETGSSFGHLHLAWRGTFRADPSAEVLVGCKVSKAECEAKFGNLLFSVSVRINCILSTLFEMRCLMSSRVRAAQPSNFTNNLSIERRAEWLCSDFHLIPLVIIINQNQYRRTVTPKGLTMRLHTPPSFECPYEVKQTFTKRPFLDFHPPTASTTSRAYPLVFPFE